MHNDDNMSEEQDEQHPPQRRIWPTIIVIGLLAVAFLTQSSFLTVGTVNVYGNERLDAAEIRRIAGVEESLNTLRLSTSEMKRRLESDLRLCNITVMRQGITTITIRVDERQPAAMLATSYGFAQIDNQGLIMAVSKSIKHIKTPLITGIKLGNVYVGDRVTEPEIKAVMEYLDALDVPTRTAISEINLNSAGQLTVYTTDAILIRLGAPERIADKAAMTLEILKEIRTKNIRTEYIDLQSAAPFIRLKNR